jgi:hypothetical protein
MKPVFWLRCYGCIFHGTGNSAQLCQNLWNFGGFDPPPPGGTSLAILSWNTVRTCAIRRKVLTFRCLRVSSCAGSLCTRLERGTFVKVAPGKIVSERIWSERRNTKGYKRQITWQTVKRKTILGNVPVICTGSLHFAVRECWTVCWTGCCGSANLSELKKRKAKHVIVLSLKQGNFEVPVVRDIAGVTVCGCQILETS